MRGEKARPKPVCGLRSPQWGVYCLGARRGQNSCTFKSHPEGGWGSLPASPSRGTGVGGLHGSRDEGQSLSAVLYFVGVATQCCKPTVRSFWMVLSAPRACYKLGRPCRPGSHKGRQTPALGSSPLIPVH